MRRSTPMRRRRTGIVVDYFIISCCITILIYFLLCNYLVNNYFLSAFVTIYYPLSDFRVRGGNGT